MFTGIVREVGSVAGKIKRSSLTKFIVKAKEISKIAELSDSIALNGVCLTVISKNKDLISFDVVEATLKDTTLDLIRIGQLVNLEPALTVGDKLGGHFVLGHVDSKIKLKKIIRRNEYYQLHLELTPKIKKYIVEKGSVALDGVSLTVKKVLSGYFTVDIIPFTYKHTTFYLRKVGDFLNVECDYLLKRK
ncbi:MAG: riboflavin synthase [Candidatus Omnitrophica bacterium]|nr:riboflavin synthase [Candidatus Omnitrophota bacterium]